MLLHKLKFAAAFSLIFTIGILDPAVARAQDNSDAAQTIMQAVTQAVTQAIAPSATQADNSDDGGDATDAEADGADNADPQTADDAASAQDAVSKGIDAYNAKDNVSAVKWFSEGAYKYHDARAQNDLAKFYTYGVGVPQDNNKAFKLYRSAAAHGKGRIRADAENSVGIMYAKGLGVPRNSRNASRWLNKSAMHGNRTAKTNLVGFRQHGSAFNMNAGRMPASMPAGMRNMRNMRNITRTNVNTKKPLEKK